MGCWNATCGVSNLPILLNEEVYCLLLAEWPWTDKSMTEATNLFQPVGFYFQGKYNDYGSLEDCFGEYLEQNLVFLRTHIVEKPKTDSRDCVSRDDLTIERVFDYLHQGTLFLRNPYSQYGGPKECQLFSYFIKKSIFEGIVDKYNPKIWDYNKKKFTTFDEAFTDSCMEYRDNPRIYQLGDGKTYKSFGEMPRLLGQGEVHLFSGVNFIEMRNIFEITAGLEDEYEFYTLVVHLYKIVLLIRFMNDNRQTFVPACGAGSQDTELTTHRLMSRLKNIEMKNIKNYYEE